MNRRLLAGLLILVCLSLVVTECYAWVPLSIWIDDYEVYTAVGEDAYVYADVVDGGPVEYWYWTAWRGLDLDHDDEDYSSTATVSSDTPGEYMVYVDAEDYYGQSDDDSAYVYVIDVEIDTPSSFPAYVCFGGSLAMGCTPLGVSGGTYSWSKVSGPGTVTFSPSASAEDPNFSANQPGNYTVKVEYTVEEATASDTSGTITVVKVDKVVKAGTTDEGPLYPGCPGTTVSLEAKPYPAGQFPDGEPHWTVEGPPGSSPSISESTGPNTTLSGTDKFGNYVVTGKCGNDDTGDSITVGFNLVSESGWSYYSHDWGEIPAECPDVNENYCDGKDSYELDDCDNELEVSCCEPDGSDGSNCAYRYYYNDSLLSSCIWKYSPENIFERKTATIEGTGLTYVTEMKHSNIGGDNWSHKWLEGHIGYYCSKFIIYDCITGSTGVYWRKSSSSPPQDIDQGDYCSGH